MNCGVGARYARRHSYRRGAAAKRVRRVTLENRIMSNPHNAVVPEVDWQPSLVGGTDVLVHEAAPLAEVSPVVHGVHCVAPAAEKVSAAQLVQAALPAEENVPAAQLEHTDELAAEKVPAVHGSQVAA